MAKSISKKNKKTHRRRREREAKAQREQREQRLEPEQGFGTPSHPGGGEELQALMAAGATGACTGDGDSWANGPCSKQPPGAQESPVNLDVDLDVDLADRDQLAEPEAKLRAKQLELDARERALGRREKGLNKVKGMLRRQSEGLGALRAEIDRALAQVCRAARTHTAPPLHSPPLSSEQVPTEIQHVSYRTGQIAHDLKNLQRLMAHSPANGKFINEMPAVHALLAQLKEAKAGTPKATRLEKNIKGHLEAMAGQLLRAKLEHKKLSDAVALNALRAHDASKKIGRVS